MADEVTKRKRCDVPRCPTPYDDVRRIQSTMEGEGTVVMDLCKTDRAPIVELRKHAHKRVRARRIQVTEPPGHK